MRKIGAILYATVRRGAIRLSGAVRLGPARRCSVLLGAARCCAARLGSMALLLGVLLLGGCIKEEAAPLEQYKASVQFDVGARAADASAPTSAEGKIYTLRVYAFVGGRPAGHYYTDAVTDGQHTFFMDLVFFSDGVQTVDFYVVANEGAMSLKMAPSSSSSGTDFTLTETTSEADLNNVWFNNQLRVNLATKGLPMFYKNSVELDFRNVKATAPPEGSGHGDHVLLDYKLNFELQRPVGKIGIFAAKAAGEEGTLHVTGLTLLANGVKVRNYLMPQTQETLRNVLSGGQDISIAVADGPVTAQLTADAMTDPAARKDPANYTPVTAEHFYPFENPWSNGGAWNIPGDEKGHVLKIDYYFEGDDAHTGYVYLPAIERNNYYAVCCLIHADGDIYVEYSVKDWERPSGEGYNENGEYELDFEYPYYTNPLQPADGSTLPEGGQYPQPTVWQNTDENSTEGCYTFMFWLYGPVGLKWNPVMMNATTDNFEVEVYQMNQDGTKDVKYRYGGTGTSINNCVADANNPFYIAVRALQPYDPNRPPLSLGIAYGSQWLPDDPNTPHSPLLLINGLTSDLSYEGSSYAEFVVIRQVDIPSVQTTANR